MCPRLMCKECRQTLHSGTKARLAESGIPDSSHTLQMESWHWNPAQIDLHACLCCRKSCGARLPMSEGRICAASVQSNWDCHNLRLLWINWFFVCVLTCMEDTHMLRMPLRSNICASWFCSCLRQQAGLTGSLELGRSVVCKILKVRAHASSPAWSTKGNALPRPLWHSTCGVSYASFPT